MVAVVVVVVLLLSGMLCIIRPDGQAMSDGKTNASWKHMYMICCSICRTCLLSVCLFFTDYPPFPHEDKEKKRRKEAGAQQDSVVGLLVCTHLLLGGYIILHRDNHKTIPAQRPIC